ncbi:MFS transporter [Neobacillus niacini]|uniref:MFS transporter n=1 Tax=Neobacillus niacini TaxID=86668 RepID=UPI002041DEE8|nr:MFS transporter [Neobacillus niacini]MCM3691091.1 MFS transporter [Neobacillus niacini]
MPNRGRILFGLSITTILAPLTQTIYTPSLLQIGEFFKINVILVNSSISIFSLFLAIGQLFVGPISDTRGRKAVLLPGLILFIIGSGICFFTANIYFFLIGRTIQAIGISTGSVIAAAVIGDIYPEKERGSALSIYQTMVFLGPVFGPVIGSAITGLIGWKWVFMFVILVGAFSLFYNKITLYETLPKEIVPRKFCVNTYKKFIIQPSSFAIMLYGFMQFYSFYVFIVFIPSLLDRLFSLSIEIKGLFFLPLTIGIVMGVFFGGRMEKYFSRRQLLITSSYSSSFIVFLFLISLQLNIINEWVIIILLLLYGVLHGLSLPSQSAAILKLFPEEKGTSIGFFNFIRFTGSAVGPLLGAVIYKLGGEFPLYLTLSTLLLITAIVIHKNMFEESITIKTDTVSKAK